MTYLEKDEHGTITVKSTGYGRTIKEAITEAHKNAIIVLLFRGLPGSDVSKPLLANESETRSKNAAYFVDLIDGEGYRKFLISSVESSDVFRENGMKKIVVDVKLNLNGLKRDLEENKLIRKFGY